MNITMSVPGRWCMVAGVTTWTGVTVGLVSTSGAIALIALCGAAALISRQPAVVVVAIFLVAGTASGFVSSSRTDAIFRAEVPGGRVTISARIAEEAAARSYGRAVIEPISLDGLLWRGPRLAATGIDASIAVGSTVMVVGVLSPGMSRVRDELVAGVLHVDEVLDVLEPSNPIVRVGNAARDLVTTRYDGSDETDGLIRGLLVGDTDLLRASDEEDLRRAGLAHYIAVSGSNVAMFLVAWWFLTAPIAVRPVLRVVGGLIGLAVFAVITRWEPSVVRASVMAATLLVGGLAGIPLDPWMALGTAVALLLLVSGHLAFSVGFQLSVAATIGVILGVAAASGRKPVWLYMPLYVTMGAQLAVAPIILVVFGTLPLLAPITNLIVGPLVTITTAVGAFAIVLPFLKPIAGLGGNAILIVAHVSAAGPQLGVLAFVTVASALAGAAWRPTRFAGLGALLLIVMFGPATARPWPDVPTLVVLDVGQGDSILLQDPSGFSLLVDGGSNARVLDRALRRIGVDRLDVVVVTHADIDHLGGLVELLSGGGASELWIPADAPQSDLLDDVVASARGAGVVVREVRSGLGLTMSEMRVDVIGPVRRYLADNNSSIVLWVTAGRTVFLGGDVESVAQADLPELHPDIMVVPHHGSASTDLRWLERTVGAIAILSYGPNQYGHPNPEVVAVLENAGAVVSHTFLEGDVSVSLSPP